MGRLGVDLLCADARVAVELDGADPIAYRRDRRKDQVIQESGHLVLRFLAEDVGRQLDFVLEAVLRSVSTARQERAPPALGIAERADASS
jgi:very-short-patch-repair endonuclease